MDPVKGWNKALAGEAPGGYTAGAALLLGWEAPLEAQAVQELPTVFPGVLGFVTPHAPAKHWEQVCILLGNHCPSS